MLKILFIVALFLLSFGILFLNEDKTMRHHLTLEQITNEIVSVKWYEPVDKDNIGKVLHIAGPLNTGDPLTEPDYNIQVQAVKLRRRVSMYQWVEESVSRIGSNPHPEDVMAHDERQFYYATEWREQLIDSSSFYMRSGHQNPPNFPIEAKTQISDHVRIGDYELNEEIKNGFNNYVLITSDTRPDIPGVKLHSGFYYHGDVHEPMVGDVRIQFMLAGLEGTSYSLVGQLNESGIIDPFRSTYGHHLLILKQGDLSMEQIMAEERFALNLKSWMMRTLGTALLFMALTNMMDLLVKYRFEGTSMNLNLLRSLRYTGVRISFALATSLLLVSLLWSIHRPWVGLGLFLSSGVLYIFCLKAI